MADNDKLKIEIQTLYSNLQVRQQNLRWEMAQKEAKIEALRETEIQMEKIMEMMKDAS